MAVFVETNTENCMPWTLGTRFLHTVYPWQLVTSMSISRRDVTMQVEGSQVVIEILATKREGTRVISHRVRRAVLLLCGTTTHFPHSNLNFLRSQMFFSSYELFISISFLCYLVIKQVLYLNRTEFGIVSLVKYSSALLGGHVNEAWGLELSQDSGVMAPAEGSVITTGESWPWFYLSSVGDSPSHP